MEITFLGQQSWIIGKDNINILVDPLLTETFGTSLELQFRVYPPRFIDVNKLPKISSIFITNEHLDHFHLLSLKLLDKSIPVYVGNMTPNCVKLTIKTLGFELRELYNSEPVLIDCLKVRFYIGQKEVPFWEKRVYQLYVTDADNKGVFIQSDTLVSNKFIKLVQDSIEPCPNIFIATNNAQILPKDRYGAFDNLLPITNPYKSGLAGLNAFEEILVEYPAKLPAIEHLLLSGGGYIIDNKDSKPFLYSNANILEKHLNDLAMDVKIHALNPGERVIFNNKSFVRDQIEGVNLYHDLHNKRLDNYTVNDHKPNISLDRAIFNEYESKAALGKENLDLINEELAEMAKLLILSNFGKVLLSTNEYLKGSINSKRFIINFKLNKNNSIFYVLDLNLAAFKQIKVNVDDLLDNYPFGIELYIGDFLALLHGKIQIWELATANVRQWYLGDRMDSPVAFLYCYFSEQIRQDLAYKVYKQINAQ